MKNVNYVYGKTLQGELITFDGFRVESYAIYEDEEEGTLVDLLFKSGGFVTVYAHVDEGCEIIDCLCDCASVLKKNPNLLTKGYPDVFIGCDSSKNKEFFFDGNTVEYYTRDESDDEDLVELHFVSGHIVEVFNDLDDDLYPGESVETLVNNCICHYFKDEQE